MDEETAGQLRQAVNKRMEQMPIGVENQNEHRRRFASEG
jgi:hypothetical protein